MLLYSNKKIVSLLLNTDNDADSQIYAGKEFQHLLTRNTLLYFNKSVRGSIIFHLKA